MDPSNDDGLDIKKRKHNEKYHHSVLEKQKEYDHMQQPGANTATMHYIFSWAHQNQSVKRFLVSY